MTKRPPKPPKVPKGGTKGYPGSHGGSRTGQGPSNVG